MNDKNNKPESKNLLERLLEHIANNPFITLWSIAIIVGGLVAFIHYVRLGYIPEINLETAATILIAVALAGAALTLAIAFFFIAPAFYLRMILEEKATEPDSGNDPAEQAILAKRRRDGIQVIGPALAAVGLWGTAFWCAGKTSLWAGSAALVLLLATMFGPWLFSRRRSRPAATQSRPLSLVTFGCACVVWFFFLGLAGLLLETPIFANTTLSKGEKTLYLLIFLGVFILSNTVLAIPNLVQNKRLVPLILFFFTAAPAVVFLELPGNPVSIEKQAFNNLGLGGMKNTIFLVKQEACDAINIVREHACIPLASKTSGKARSDAPQGGCVRPDFLENRLGSEFLLVYEGEPQAMPSGRKSKSAPLLIPLKKEDVVLWAHGGTTTAGIAACPRQQ